MVCQMQLNLFYTFDIKGWKIYQHLQEKRREAVCIYASVVGDALKGEQE